MTKCHNICSFRQVLWIIKLRPIWAMVDQSLFHVDDAILQPRVRCVFCRVQVLIKFYDAQRLLLPYESFLYDSWCIAVGLQDTACQTSPTTPRLQSRKLYKTEKMNQYNELEGKDARMLLDHDKEDHSHLVKRVKPKLPLLKLRNGRNNQ